MLDDGQVGETFATDMFGVVDARLPRQRYGGR